jgi:4-hydroxybenzoate polyprenyltransferase
VVLLPLVGYGWAHWDRALTPVGGRDLAWVLVAWALLHAGTLWLNAAVDRDEGEVLMGAAIPVPAGIQHWGFGALLVSVALAVIADPLSGTAAALCAALAVLYSHPATLWKGHSVLGPVVNGVGYALLSPLAGWAVVDVTPNARTLVVWALGAVGILGCYFAAQAFQGPEDAARGYRTLVVTHGPRAAVLAGRVSIGVGFLVCVVLAAVGWFPRICLLAVPTGVWVDRWFARWMHQPDGGNERWARGMANRLLASGLLVLGLVLGVYFDQVRREVPVAGLGTAAGHPPDRPLLPPIAMRHWEHRQALRALHQAEEGGWGSGGTDE